MSLINQVLSDLEKRGASTNIGEATIRVVAVKQKHDILWMMLAAASLPIVLAAVWMKWGEALQSNVPSASPATAPHIVMEQPASPVVAISTIGIPVPVLAPVLNSNSKPITLSKETEWALQPLLQLPPAIASVSPNPVTINASSQAITIRGHHFTRDAVINLRTPKGNIYTKRQLVSQDAATIIFKVSIAKTVGQWSVEVLNPGTQSADPSSPAELSSGQFKFLVQAKPLAISTSAHNKADLPVVAATENVKNAMTVAPSTGGVGRRPTQVTPHQQAENEFRKAYALMQQGQISTAISRYEAALQLDPSHIVARQTLVRVLLESKRSIEAERVLQEGLQLDLKQSSLAMLLARIQVAGNELTQALDTMQRSLPYAQQQPDYQAFIAALLQRQHRHMEAIVYFQNAVQLSPQSGVWWMGLGISLRAEQRNADAKEAFNRALETHKLSTELQSFVTQQLKEL